MQPDVVIVGGGIAGCTAALLFARQQLMVTVIEKKKAITDYKRLCTHFIQPSALPVIKKLQLDAAIEAAGGLPNKADIWTKAGWIRSASPYAYGDGAEHGYNIERRVLDPLLRSKLYEEPTVQYISASKVTAIGGSEQPYVVYTNGSGQETTLNTRLVVAADGRFSAVAKLTGNEGTLFTNNRFACFAYFRQVVLGSGGHSQFWTLDPDMAFAYPLQNDTVLLCLFIRKTEWPAWQLQMEKNFMAFVAGLPDGPHMCRAMRISSFYCMREMPNIVRPAVKNGVAFIGDAAMALDPMSGVGCGFAFQSAAWLADHTMPALLSKSDLMPALEQYKQFHQARLMPHAAGIHADSLAEPHDENKIHLYREVVQDAELTDLFLALTGRIITPQAFQTQYLKKMLAKRKQIIQTN